MLQPKNMVCCKSAGRMQAGEGCEVDTSLVQAGQALSSLWCGHTHLIVILGLPRAALFGAGRARRQPTQRCSWPAWEALRAPPSSTAAVCSKNAAARAVGPAKGTPGGSQQSASSALSASPLCGQGSRGTHCRSLEITATTS